MQQRLIRLFIQSAAAVLLLTAVAKLVSTGSSSKILSGPDPVFGILNIDIRTVILSAELIEIIVAWICFRGHRLTVQVASVFWLSLTFVLYRVTMSLTDYDKPCACLGTITDALGIAPDAADYGMKLALAYLVIGSGAAKWWLWRQARGANDSPVPQSAQVSSGS